LTDAPVRHRHSALWLALGGVTWLLVGFGALVRVEQAGLACPDWPLCFGEVIPDIRLEGVIYEFGHRVLAGLVSIGFAILAMLAWRAPHTRSKVRRPLILAAVVLLLQVVMGGLTVLIVDKPEGAAMRPAAWTVTTHLILGNLFVALTFLIGLRLSGGSSAGGATVAWRRLLAAWSASLLAQFILGGVIAANLAGLICIEFPTCNGGIWFPSWSGLVGVQLAHRLNGFALLALAICLAALATDGRSRLLGRLLLAAVVLQIGLGAANIWFALPTAVTVGHSAVASALFVMSLVAWDTSRGPAVAATEPR